MTLDRANAAAALAVLLLLPVRATAQPKIDNKPMFAEAIDPGGTIVVTGSGFATPISGDLYNAAGQKTTLDPPAISDDKTITFRLPRDIQVGRYAMRVSIGGVTDIVVPGELRVRQPEIKLDAAHPTTAYRDGTGGFSFALIGQNFPALASDLAVDIEGEGAIVVPMAEGATAKKTPDEEMKSCNADTASLPCLWVEDHGHRIQVRGLKPGKFQGPVMVRVRAGGASQSEVVSNTTKLVFARMSSTGVLLSTVAVFALLVVTLSRLVAGGLKDTLIHGRRYSPWYAFLFDSQTNSYSLSKFQLFAFFFTFVFGYLYVILCRLLVQWQFSLPDVPSNLAAMLGVSGATTLAATAATQTRGSKGGGELYPSFADFVTTGGQVLPERFQFFVWTLIACSGFVALLIAQDPATIQNFPSFPDGLLYVMGVSAGAYIGGKVTRPAGPVIKNVALDAKANPVIIVQGENLSSDADYLIDDDKLPIATKDEKEAAGLRAGPDGKINLVECTPQVGASDRTFCSELRVTVLRSKAAAIFKPGPHKFRIVNQDGQFAETQFSLPSPTISNVLPATVAAGATGVQLTVTGIGFYAPITAEWTPVNGTPQAVEPSVDSETQVTVKVDAGPAGAALLKVSAAGGDASTTVTVA